MVRPAVLTDAEALASLHIRSWQAAYDGIVPALFLDSLPDSLERRTSWFTNAIGTTNPKVQVADHDGPAGFVMTGISEDGQNAELFAIYVDPEHWGHGHGHDLLAAAEEHLKTLGPPPPVLWVLEANRRARDFYEAHGWTLSKRSALLTIGGADVTEVRYERPL